MIEGIKKASKCLVCGDTRWYVLQFHHRNSAEKEGLVSQMVDMPDSRILEEIAKCDLLCSNCHIELHFKEREKAKAAQAAAPSVV